MPNLPEDWKERFVKDYNQMQAKNALEFGMVPKTLKETAEVPLVQFVLETITKYTLP